MVVVVVLGSSIWSSLHTLINGDFDNSTLSMSACIEEDEKDEEQGGKGCGAGHVLLSSWSENKPSISLVSEFRVCTHFDTNALAET